MNPALTSADILDLRAYERVRPQMQAEALTERSLRRVELGPIITGFFESRTTIRHQIHEMLRAERALGDDAVAAELAAYNPLLPTPVSLSLTVFIELTSPEQMQRWLPALVGIEQHLLLVAPDAPVQRSVPEAGHATTLTRSSVTSAVHYLRLPVPDPQLLRPGTALVVDHPAYRADALLTEELLRALRTDLA
jgi:hypothetical protein